MKIVRDWFVKVRCIGTFSCPSAQGIQKIQKRFKRLKMHTLQRKTSHLHKHGFERIEQKKFFRLERKPLKDLTRLMIYRMSQGFGPSENQNYFSSYSIMEDLIDKTEALVDASEILRGETIAPQDKKDIYQSLKGMLKIKYKDFQNKDSRRLLKQLVDLKYFKNGD